MMIQQWRKFGGSTCLDGRKLDVRTDLNASCLRFGRSNITHDKGHTFFRRRIYTSFIWLHGAIGQDSVGIRSVRALYEGKIVFVQQDNRLNALSEVGSMIM